MSETKENTNETIEHSITLIGGYTDKEGVTHRDVTFGKRVNMRQMMSLDTDPLAQNNTQYGDAIRRFMITKFGSLRMAVPHNVLYSLDTIDRDDLEKAEREFMRLGRGERKAEQIAVDELKLPFGFIIDGAEYNIIKFGNRITGKDDIDADDYGVGVMRECFLIGRQISKISTEDGLLFIDGQVGLERFEQMDAESLGFLRVGAELFRQSFRFKGNEDSGKNAGDVSDSKRNGDDGNGSSGSADGTN